MNMNTADQQVIAMVNAPHERRAREAARRRREQMEKRRKQSAVDAFVGLLIKLECCTIAAGFFLIAIGYGWMADWVGTLGIMACPFIGFICLRNHERRRNHV